MSELRYPNENKAYRDARDALLKEERELADKVKAVAEKRRKRRTPAPSLAGMPRTTRTTARWATLVEVADELSAMAVISGTR